MIRENIASIQKKISETAISCGRNPEDIKLVAVSKRFQLEAILEANRAGQTIFGENYIQEANHKYEQLPKSIRLHCIGNIQSNKAKTAAEIFSMIETVDRLKLAKLLNQHLTKINKKLDILIQVNVGGEQNKSGISPEKAEGLLKGIQPLTMLRPLGLMTIPPHEPIAENSRPYFRELRLLTKSLQKKNLFCNMNKVELSMGMTNDYPIAIEEGATLVRIGTAIFGQRPPIK